MKHKQEIVKVVLSTRKVYAGSSIEYQKGQIVDAEIGADGRARIVNTPFVVLAPAQYEIYIPEQDYDMLLFMDDEDGELA